jgi:hypothetical protein
MGTGEHGELAQAQNAFALHFVQQAEEAARQLDGPNVKRAEAFLRREGENCMEAIRVLFDVDKPTGLRLLVAAGEVASECRVDLQDGMEWAERYHEACKDMPPSRYTARLAYLLGWGRWFKIASDEMPWEIGQCWEEAVRLAAASGDLATLGQAQVCRGMAGYDLPAEARAALATDGIANARASGNQRALAFALHIVATDAFSGTSWSGRDFPSRKKYMEEALAIAERSPDQLYLAGMVNAMGRVLAFEKMFAEATPWLVRADEMVRNLEAAPLWFSFDLPKNYLELGQPEKARPHAREAFAAAIGVGDPKIVCEGLLCYILLAFMEAKNERGAKLYRAWMAQVSPGKEPPAEHLAMIDEAGRQAVRKEWASGQAMRLDEAVAYVKEDW